MTVVNDFFAAVTQDRVTEKIQRPDRQQQQLTTEESKSKVKLYF